ncbi:hypothetical protein Mapa_013105 [Marchantia paleacea]|nr:hypothetical protein Mapa_013105 [Marchantia paleacea]
MMYHEEHKVSMICKKKHKGKTTGPKMSIVNSSSDRISGLEALHAALNQKQISLCRLQWLFWFQILILGVDWRGRLVVSGYFDRRHRLGSLRSRGLLVQIGAYYMDKPYPLLIIII